MGYALTVQLPDEETFRSLERTAEILGMSMSELGEAALQIAALSTDLEGRLARMSERLKTYDEADLERDIQEFAHSEVAYEDPLQTHRMEMQDPYGIGALFGRRLERG
ncbi:MAG TPA: hypothetical protein VH394_27745 [Thermoanaerobaculia bacterium]|jgi:predicted HTH domain antitoxin|nr:hypothetical protein [Thermoanaerobaculia bacterium]